MKEKYKIEEEIRELIFNDNKNSTHFEYEKLTDEIFQVKVITLNKRTNATFLLASSKGNSESDAIQNALDNISSLEGYHTFTIKWYIKGEKADRPFKSKFKALDIYKALDKFYHGNNDTKVIYSISDDDIKSRDYEG